MTFVLLALSLQAQERKKFSPEQFEAELQQFITTEAGLSVQEAARFFPVYWEMQSKQRVLFQKMRNYHFVDARDNEACMEAIIESDKIDLEIKELQQEYHLKFCRVLPASKVLQVIRAEGKFHRQAFRRAAKRDR